jgi:hypothetical protein
MRIMRDDRIPLQLAAIDATMSEQMDRIASEPMSTWELVGTIAGEPAARMRSLAISAGLTSAVYINGHLREARRGPWALLAGNRRLNVEMLAAGAPPEDEVMFKMYEMVRLGMGVDLVLEGLDAMSRCSWSTLPEEQGHVSASSLMKLHRQYGVATLQCRSMILQCRPLFAACPWQRKIDIKRRHMAKLSRTQHSRLKGRHVYVR